jgi:hypothetical protein
VELTDATESARRTELRLRRLGEWAVGEFFFDSTGDCPLDLSDGVWASELCVVTWVLGSSSLIVVCEGGEWSADDEPVRHEPPYVSLRLWLAWCLDASAPGAGTCSCDVEAGVGVCDRDVFCEAWCCSERERARLGIWGRAPGTEG